MRTRILSSNVLSYIYAIALIAAVLAMFLVVRDVLETSLIALLLLIPVGVAALWGLGPSITAGVCAFFGFNYFFIRPYYTLAVHRSEDLVILLVFLVVAVVISQLVGQAQAGLAAATAREREATLLYELTTVLADLHDDQSIAKTLTEQVQALFMGEYVELNVTGAQTYHFHLPEHATAPSRPPELTLPIQAVRGVLGKIQLWRTEPAISSSEKRLLQTFASQGALSIERTLLAQSESRAKVLEESDRLKSALLSSVSHELRTPLATIKAAASSLRSNEVGWDSSARVELVAAIDDEADHLNMLVGNLLDMSRLESGALKPQRQWNILSEIVGGVLKRMHRVTETHQLEIDIPEDLPLIPVDFVQIEQVFSNLISNSAKYAPAQTKIRIHAKEKENQVFVQVSNQGPTVPAEHLERIFDKFYRVTDADRVTGTGLGLSICKGIIEAHDGRIWAENLSNGFAFNFTLPLTWNGAPPRRLPTESEA